MASVILSDGILPAISLPRGQGGGDKTPPTKVMVRRPSQGDKTGHRSKRDKAWQHFPKHVPGNTTG